MQGQELEFNNSRDSVKETGASALSNFALDEMRSFDFNTKKAMPKGFPSADDFFGPQETKGIKEDVLELAKKESKDGGQAVSGDYATVLSKDIGDPKFLNAVNKLTHEGAMKSLEELRQNNSSGKLLESDLRQAYAKATVEQRVAILYALSNFEDFARAGNWATKDWSPDGTAIHKVDLENAKEPGKK